MCIRDRVDSWCGSREGFLGRYHGYNNPVGVEDGILNCEGNYNENGCGALATILTLDPGETKEIAFLVGMKEDVDASRVNSSVPWAYPTSRRGAVYRRKTNGNSRFVCGTANLTKDVYKRQAQGPDGP